MAQKSSVEIVIPIYNEEKELEENIKKLHSFLEKKIKNYNWQITIVDNASTDKSLAIAQKLGKTLKNTKTMHLPQKGRGRAVKAAWEKSNAEILAYMDVDLSTDLNNFPTLLETLTNGYDIAIGSRLLSQSHVEKRPVKREVLSRGYNIIIKLFFGVHFSDAQCGFKAVTHNVVKKLIPHIKDNGWFFDSELLIVGEKTGFRIAELPVVWVDNPGSTVRVLKTVYGDLKGLTRLFIDRPWEKIKSKELIS
ncbi:glycosyltransferase family 2 protein [Candidatus Gottesmanbacteria bacterium]|nr:glycosyltransferase family 2 protein [Candidatus Gottesmanbacteria bacterium]